MRKMIKMLMAALLAALLLNGCIFYDIPAPEAYSSQPRPESIAPEESHKKLLAPLAELLDAGDKEGLAARLRTAEYVKVVETIASATSGSPASACIYYGEQQDEQRHGKGIALYGSGFIYYGQWENNFRHGKGLWVNYTADPLLSWYETLDYTANEYARNYYCELTWENDLPNGKGVMEFEAKRENWDAWEWQRITGPFVNGLAHGSFTTEGTSPKSDGSLIDVSYTHEMNQGTYEICLDENGQPETVVESGITCYVLSRSMQVEGAEAGSEYYVYAHISTEDFDDGLYTRVFVPGLPDVQ